MARDLDSPQRRARTRASQIRAGALGYLHTLALVKAALEEEDWRHLGYDSVEAWVAEEFSSLRLRVPADLRDKAIEELRLRGLTQRAIADAVGVSASTVNRALGAGVSNETRPIDIPSPTSPASRPSPPHPTDETGTSQPVRVPPHPGGPVESPSAPGVDVGVVDTTPPVTAVATDEPAGGGVAAGQSPVAGGDTPEVETRLVIEAAKLSAATLAADVRKRVGLIVAGVRWGASQIVTGELVAELRAAADELEGLLT